MPLLSFVVPVYRNEGTILPTAERIRAFVEGLGPSYRLELLFVDDGSDDGSPAELAQARAADPRVGVLTLSRNFGQVLAVTEGLRRVRGDAAVVMSADLQDPVERLAGMVEAWNRGSRIVIGHRTSRDDGILASAASRAFHRLVRISLPTIPEGGFDFLLLDRQALDTLNRFGGRNRFFQGDVLWLGFPTTFLPHVRERRPRGRSQWTLGKKMKYSLDGLLGTAYWPIRLMSLCGVVTALMGFAYAAAIVYAWARHSVPFEGWAPLMILILVVGGVLMIMLGVIGEYVWRIYDEVRGRPLVAVREFQAPGGPPGDGDRGEP